MSVHPAELAAIGRVIREQTDAMTARVAAGDGQVTKRLARYEKALGELTGVLAEYTDRTKGSFQDASREVTEKIERLAEDLQERFLDAASSVVSLSQRQQGLSEDIRGQLKRIETLDEHLLEVQRKIENAQHVSVQGLKTVDERVNQIAALHGIIEIVGKTSDKHGGRLVDLEAAILRLDADTGGFATALEEKEQELKVEITRALAPFQTDIASLQEGRGTTRKVLTDHAAALASQGEQLSRVPAQLDQLQTGLEAARGEVESATACLQDVVAATAAQEQERERLADDIDQALQALQDRQDKLLAEQGTRFETFTDTANQELDALQAAHRSLTERQDALRGALTQSDQDREQAIAAVREALQALRERQEELTAEQSDRVDGLVEIMDPGFEQLHSAQAALNAWAKEHAEAFEIFQDEARGALERVRKILPEIDRWLDDGETRPQGKTLTHRGGIWQARVSTQEEPGSGEDWDLVVNGVHDVQLTRPGHDVVEFAVEAASAETFRWQITLPTPKQLGTWKEGEEHKRDDVVTDGGHRWIASVDSPEGRPSDPASGDWKLFAMRGARGRKGDRGDPGLDGRVPPVEEVVKQWREYLEADESIAINRYRGAWTYTGDYARGDVISVGRGLYLSTKSGRSEIPPGPMDEGRWLMLVEPLAFGGGGGGSGTDELVGVTENDTAPGYLSDQVQSADGSVAFSVINAGGDEVLDLQATGAGGGESNLGSNVGGGTEIYKGKNGVALEIRTVGATASVVPALNGDLLELTVQDDVVVPGPHSHDAFAGPGTEGFVPDPVTDTGKFLAEGGSWQQAPVSPIGGVELSYNWDSSIVAADPGAGNIRGNNVDHTLITELYVHDETRLGNDAHFIWDSMHTGEFLGIWDESGQASSWYGMLTGEPTDNGTYHTLPVSVIPGTVGGMDNNSKVSVFPIHNPEEKIPVGGTTGQHLAKASDANFDTEWVDAAINSFVADIIAS